MFDGLAERFQTLFSNFTKSKKITQENVKDAVRDVKVALLEADVNFNVVGAFVNRVKEIALGEKVVKSVSPSQQFIEVVHSELVKLMGSEEKGLTLLSKPSVVMLCGLQGCGKTTTAAKLALFLKKEGKRVLVAACDLQRPAAVEQLEILCSSIGVDIFKEGDTPLSRAKDAHERAKSEKYDVLILDTAGRLSLDGELMVELKALKDSLRPDELLFVASAAMGQDAVSTALEFEKKVGITGSILTMLDGSARAGAAISIREVTSKPLKFEGIGEKVGDLQLFNPKSMSDRILGMGDVINLVKKAKEHISEEESKKLEKKLRDKSFSYEDYLKQMGMIKKMGSMKGLLKMIPGMPSSLSDGEKADKEFSKVEAVINSMTPAEKQEKVELDYSRKKRIAKGAGCSMDDVNRLSKAFKRMKQLFKDLPKKGMPDMNQIKNHLGGGVWR